VTASALEFTRKGEAVEVAAPPRRLVVVDDHRVFAEALVVTLSMEADLDVLGMAHSVTTGIALAQRLVPDLVVMDVRLGDGDGVAAGAELARQFPAMAVVVLTGFVDEGLLERVADAGAAALLPKDGELTEMLRAIRTARRGRFIVHPALLRRVAAHGQPNGSDIPPLTGQEPDVLRLLAAGFDPASIGRELDLTNAVARDVVQALLTKLRARSPLDAVVIAMRNGLLRDSSAD
jgi:DNA-binding NarL/FixJ family response regulator